MFEIDALSFLFGICFGVIPTVFIMTAAVIADDVVNQKRGK